MEGATAFGREEVQRHRPKFLADGVDLESQALQSERNEEGNVVGLA